MTATGLGAFLPPHVFPVALQLNLSGGISADLERQGDFRTRTAAMIEINPLRQGVQKLIWFFLFPQWPCWLVPVRRRGALRPGGSRGGASGHRRGCVVTTRNTSRAFLRSAGRAVGCCGFVLHRLKAPCMPLIVRIPLLGGARFYLRNDTGRAESIAKYYLFFF